MSDPAISAPADALELDRDVCSALRKEPGESIADAARRIMASPHGDPAWRVARAVLHPTRGVWASMRRAAKAARRLARDSGG